MGRPNQFRTLDAFTPTGSGRPLRDVFPTAVVPPHVARYKGRPPYVTPPAEQERLRREGDK